jgi:hypothetical protein
MQTTMRVHEPTVYIRYSGSFAEGNRRCAACFRLRGTPTPRCGGFPIQGMVSRIPIYGLPNF